MINKGHNLVSILWLLFWMISCNQSDQKPLGGKTKTNGKLPYLGNPEVIVSTRNGREYMDTIYPKIPSFSFFSQDSIRVTRDSFREKIWVVEFFFARCPTVCPVMNKQMKRLHKELETQHPEIAKKLQILSFSIDPKHDTPSVLRNYRSSYGISARNWTMLTGDEELTHRLGIKHFLVFAGKDDNAAGNYAHSGAFTLVDTKGYVRGVYQITDNELNVNEQEYQKLVNDIKLLYNE
ncbi:MAG: SCO family protein [Flavobacteriales bacterium]